MLRLHYVPGGHGNHILGHLGQNVEGRDGQTWHAVDDRPEFNAIGFCFRPQWKKRDERETTPGGGGGGMEERDSPWLPWMPGQIFKLSKSLPRQSRCGWQT